MGHASQWTLDYRVSTVVSKYLVSYAASYCRPRVKSQNLRTVTPQMKGL